MKVLIISLVILASLADTTPPASTVPNSGSSTGSPTPGTSTSPTKESNEPIKDPVPEFSLTLNTSAPKDAKLPPSSINATNLLNNTKKEEKVEVNLDFLTHLNIADEEDDVEKFMAKNNPVSVLFFKDNRDRLSTT
jgi:hypothetical protein